MKVLDEINLKLNRKFKEINSKFDNKEKRRIYINISNVRDQIESFKT
jgi:hypothetical protein